MKAKSQKAKKWVEIASMTTNGGKSSLLPEKPFDCDYFSSSVFSNSYWNEKPLTWEATGMVLTESGKEYDKLQLQNWLFTKHAEVACH